MNHQNNIVIPLTQGEFTRKKPVHIVRSAVRIAVLAICAQQIKCLFVKHPTKGIELPGGAIEPYELPHEAAIRELREEAGLSLSDQQTQFAGFIPVVDSRGGHWLDIVLYTFIRNNDYISQFKDGEFDTQWLSIHEINKNISAQALIIILQEIIDLH